MIQHKMLNKFFISLLILALLVPFVPQSLVHASYFYLENDLESHDTIGEALTVFNSTMNISGRTDYDRATFRYSVTQVDTGNLNMPDVSPFLSEEDRFTFNNVKLYPGLNKILIESKVHDKSSRPVYVYYVDSPNISNLRLLNPDNNEFELLKTYPENTVPDPFNTATVNDTSSNRSNFNRVMKSDVDKVFVKGDSENVTTIYVNGEETMAPPRVDSFTHDLALNGIIKGDYTVTFSGENSDGGTFSFPYSFAIQNSEPTLLNVAVKQLVDGSTTTEETKFLHPLDTVDVNFKNNDSINFASHVYIESGMALDKLKVLILDSNNKEIGSKELTAAEIEAEGFSTSTYNLYRIEDTIMINDPDNLSRTLETGEEYTLRFIPYQNAVTSEVYTAQSFKFKYINSNQPAIKDIIFESTNIPLKNNPLIRSKDEYLIVTVNDKTEELDFTTTPRYSSTPVTIDTFTSTDIDGNGNIRVPLSALERGIQTLTFIPKNNTTGTTGEVRSIEVDVSFTPTLIITGIANQQRFTDLLTNNIKVQYVNLGNTTDRGKTEVRLNNEKISAADILGDLKNDSFEVKSSAFTNDSLEIGINTLKFIIYSNSDGATTKTEIKIEFFYLPNKSPNFGTFVPLDTETSTSDNFYSIPDQTGVYTTTEKKVKLNATTTNQEAKKFILWKGEERIAEATYRSSTDDWAYEQNISVVINGEDEEIDSDDVIKIEKDRDDKGYVITTLVSSNSLLFDTGGIFSLLEKDEKDGTTIWTTTSNYKVEAYNDRDNYPLASKTITIIRRNGLYEFTGQAASIMGENGNYGIVNQNFFPFDIYTEQADQVIINKVQAKKIEEDMNRGMRYYADVPLKEGSNKMKVEIIRGEETLEDEFEVYYSAQVILGSAFRETLGRSTKFSVFDKQLQLTFPKGTVLQSQNGSTFNQLINEVPIMFGIADPYRGIISQHEINGNDHRDLARNLANKPYGFNIAGPLFYVDAGTVNQPGGLYPLDDRESIVERADHEDENLVPTQRGELVIEYNNEFRDELTRRLTVMYHDGDNWTNLGGVLDERRQTITVPFDGFGYYTVMRMNEVYRDVASHSWARDELQLLIARNWMVPNGRSAMDFGAYDSASRGELATLLVKVFNIRLDYEGDQTFVDVPRIKNGVYDYRYIETAARVGIVNGESVGIFNPDGSLTREHAAMMIARAANYRLNEYERATRTVEKAFVDGATINRYAVPAVEAMLKNDIIQGNPIVTTDSRGKTKTEYMFDPRGTLRRDQLAKIAYALLKEEKIVR